MLRLRSGWLVVACGLGLVLTRPARVAAQGRAEDYERAEGLAAAARDKVTHDRVAPHWFDGNNQFSFRSSLGGGRHEFVVVDARTGARRVAFDHVRLGAALAKALGATIDPAALPIAAVEVGEDGSVRFNRDELAAWRYDPAANMVVREEQPLPVGPDEDGDNWPRPGSARSFPLLPISIESPDGRWLALLRGEVLYLRDKSTGTELPIISEGIAKRGRDRGMIWSPDSSKIVVVRVTPGEDHKVHLIESSPRDQVQPKLSTYDYFKPGDRVAIDRPYLYDVAARKLIDVPDDLFRNPYEINRIRWDADSKRFTFLFNQRGHQLLRVVAVDAATGAATALIDETSPTFVDYSQKTFFEFTLKGDEILWMSERSGWNHLYRIDAATGAIKNPITSGGWVVRAVDRVDHEARQVTLQVMGLVPGEDPYHVHLVRVNFDGSGLVRLTEGDGNHRVRFSPDRRFLLDTYSRVDLPPVVELRRAEDGRLVGVVERADASALDPLGLRRPERFVAQGRDGTTDIHGIIIRPSNFDPGRKYPVIEAIYAGPHGAHVPKTFRPVPAHQGLAELGFVVVQIDGMGTNWRSRAFHDVCWRNLADAGFTDRIAWMRAAAAHDPSLDLTRVGIFGGSAGGQNALGGMLFHPEFYKAAAADCGCHDNRMDKIWWNEAWMGWPIGPHYAEQSNVTNAHKLAGPLLLTVGELDHNVDPASTMQVVDALIRADKDFELIVFPGADHGAGGGRYGDRRRRDFFVRHLLGVMPPRRTAAAAGDRPAAATLAAGPLGAPASNEPDEPDEPDEEDDL